METGLNQVLRGEERPSAKPVVVSSEAFTRNAEEVRLFERGLRERLNPHKSVSVSYEDLIADTQSTVDSTFDFLGLPASAVEAPTEKANSDDLRELISNYETLFKSLRGTRLAGYLDADQG